MALIIVLFTSKYFGDHPYSHKVGAHNLATPFHWCLPQHFVTGPDQERLYSTVEQQASVEHVIHDLSGRYLGQNRMAL